MRKTWDAFSNFGYKSQNRYYMGCHSHFTEPKMGIAKNIIICYNPYGNILY